MSPRAAWRLERLGYSPVYEYAAGKVDWLAAGLETEGAGKRERRAVDVLQQALTCPPDTTVGAAVEQARSVRADSVLVVNNEGVLLGRLRVDTAEPPQETVEDAMDVGPVTVRANEPLDPLLERMAARHVREMAVTTPEGRLLGVVRR